MQNLPLVFCLLICSTLSLFGQGGPRPLQPLNPPPAPAGNPVTIDKANLGKALFWDEQLSSTRTVSCGTCHQPVSGGSDPRSLVGTTDHPGADGIFGTDDDVTGSPGVLKKTSAGLHELDDFFGIAEQVTGRYAPSAINAGYSNTLFWDGRATGRFVDPVSGQTVIANGAALESQALGPPTSDVEMAHAGRDWTKISSRIAHSVPLTLAPTVPSDLTTWINGRDYAALFEAAFGSAGVTPARIAMAIATYERTLVSNQAPIDAFIGGNQNALTAQEQLGLQVFNQSRCARCHGGNRFTDDNFHYIGLRPQDEDLGRFEVTGNAGDRGQFKTPTLRNVELRGEYMHNGRLQSLEEVVEFYNRGGDFDAPNKDNDVRPLNLTEAEKAALVAFLGRPLTDPRVAAETGLFSRPGLYAGSAGEPAINDDGVSYSGNPIPEVIAIEPSLAGSPDFTVALHSDFAVRNMVLVIDDAPIASGGGTIPDEESVLMRYASTSDADGIATVPVAIPGGGALLTKTLYGKWFVTDGAGVAAESASFETVVLGETAAVIGSPQNLQSNFAADSVSLTWDSVSGADRYEIYRGSTATFSESFRISTRTGTTFDDDSVQADTTYFYWVVAVGEEEAGTPSATEIETRVIGSFDLTATQGTSTNASDLSWREPLPDGASFEVWRGVASNPAGFSELASGLSAMAYSDASGIAARTYFYQVKLVDASDEILALSSVASGSRALSSPENLTATVAAFSDRIRLSWSGNTDATSYVIFRSNGGAAAQVGTTSGTSWDDFSVTAGLDYTYAVRSQNEYGQSGDSGTATGTKGIQAPTGVTANFTFEAGGIVLSWNAAEGVAHYAVYRSSTGVFGDAEEIDVTSGSEWIDSTAEAGLEYTYWIASIDGDDKRIVEETVFVASRVAKPAADVMIGRSYSSLKGDNVYNVSGGGQTLKKRTRRYRKVTARIAVENDGTANDSFIYRGSRENRRFRIRYRRISPVSANLTSAVIAGYAAGGEMDAGEKELFTVEIKPKRSRQKNRKKTYRRKGQFYASSVADSGQVDSVRYIIRAKY
ncbi:MAG: hypothetical protein MI807_09070 [Verrucomicrobiales bacterium]|nr:hypothetical protein [Verrucomicrobiales bacterium]